MKPLLNFVLMFTYSVCLVVAGMVIQTAASNYKANITSGNSFNVGKQFYKCNKVK